MKMQPHSSRIGPSTDYNSPLTVSELNALVKQCLENSFSYLSIEGEISNLSRPSSGHLYFTLKDERAHVRCVFFKPYQASSPPLQEGQKVLIKGKVGLYQPRGDYQLTVFSCEEAGIGALLRAYEALKKRLSDEGLFNVSHKKPLPTYPRKIGIITAPQGAAIQDVLTTLSRRYPLAEINIYPTLVQGQEAKDLIITALRQADHDDNDTLILCRGGGSIEDLWVFNEEPLIRAIFACQTPLITGIGHETDTTLSDEVADQRAPTPTAAAELCTPHSQDLIQHIDNTQRRLTFLIQKMITSQQYLFQAIQSKLTHPREQLTKHRHLLEKIQAKLTYTFNDQLLQLKLHLQSQISTLHHHHPKQLLLSHQNQYQNIKGDFQNALNFAIQSKENSFLMLINKLDTLSPLSTLKRGYTLVKQNNKPMTHCSDIDASSPIDIHFHDGNITASPIKVDSDDKN
ncbi:MAG TPA: exodeoxyribonuclease VII large subunit [Gammaproteobacteria bacterium]|nr:exodeoxyribonuclease VII large subunit [Gammaproteobacteria bacterium]